ncbi:MAG: DUF1289 domain-containing protein [Betaproteobacteria bacterium HGW-Betaproteobacteria-8]|nr:MAG: DUF1289 domain-containing protein [Betaproteobacteria bacterium HGW-Betaproteobacteria-8]
MVSPCIGICAMNASTGQCEGCCRSLEEIRGWWDMMDDERKRVMDQLEQRQSTVLDFD